MTIGAGKSIPYVGGGEFLRTDDELIPQPDLLPALPAGDGIGRGVAEEGLQPVRPSVIHRRLCAASGVLRFDATCDDSDDHHGTQQYDSHT